MKQLLIWGIIILILSGLSVSLGRKKRPEQNGQSPAPKEIVIAAGGDIACFQNWKTDEDSCKQKETAALIEQINPEAVLILGDLQYNPLAFTSWQGYEESWGKFKNISYPAIGNHEYDLPGGKGYWDYWGEKAGERGKGWYSFDLGEWHIAAVNSNCGEVGCGKESEQVRWLDGDLTASKKACKLAFMHHPRYSSGKSHGNTLAIKDMWEILDAGGVDVVLAGHEHLYERLKSGNIREFIVGTGGRSLYDFGNPKTGSEARISDSFGVLKMVLKEGGYEWEFVSEDGEAKDRGIENCTP